MKERLIKILSKKIYPKEGVDPAEVVADYLLANGVIVLPCAVGDTVYIIGNVSQEVYALTVLGVWKIEDKIQIITNQGVLLSKFYLSKEEAEKALERSEGK